MFKIIFLLFFIFTSFIGCGYQPLYLNDKDFDFSITSIKFTGNNEINKFIEKELDKYDGGKGEALEIIINSSFNKNPIIKDKKGNVTNYELVASINLEVKKDNIIKNISFNESLKIEKNNDNFEQVKYEAKIRKNLYHNLTERIVFFIKNNK